MKSEVVTLHQLSSVVTGVHACSVSHDQTRILHLHSLIT